MLVGTTKCFKFALGSGGRGVCRIGLTDPELKQWSNFRAAVRGEVGDAATKKRVGLGSLFDVEHETTPPFVAAPQQRAFPKSGVMSPTEKPAQTRRIFLLDLFLV